MGIRLWECDIVRILVGKPEHGIVAGTRGTVVMVYDAPPIPLGYEVEFLDADGDTIAVVTVDATEVELAPP